MEDFWLNLQLKSDTQSLILLTVHGQRSDLPQLDVLARVGLVRFFDVGELEVEGLRLSDFTWSGKIFDQGDKLMMVPPVVI